MPAARKVSLQQMEVLVSFLEEHREMANGLAVDKAQNKAAVRCLWKELAAMLNAQSRGVRKNHGEWRDYWRDLKYRIKKKAVLEMDSRKKRDSPTPEIILSELEQRVFAISGTQADFEDEAIFADSIPGPSYDETVETILVTEEDPESIVLGVQDIYNNTTSAKRGLTANNETVDKSSPVRKRRKILQRKIKSDETRQYISQSITDFKKRQLEMLEEEHKLNVKIAQLKIKKLELEIAELECKNENNTE